MRRMILSVSVGMMATLFLSHVVYRASASARPEGTPESAPIASLGVDASAPLDGFTANSARAERELEAKFRALPSPSNMRSYMQRISAHPHHVGTEYDRANAQWILGLFQQWGWDADIRSEAQR